MKIVITTGRDCGRPLGSKFQVKMSLVIGLTVGLADGIIDDAAGLFQVCFLQRSLTLYLVSFSNRERPVTPSV